MQPMAKADTRKGNAFAAPGMSYPALEIARKHKAEEAALDRSMLSDEERKNEEALRSIADIITASGVRGRVKKEMTDGILRARRGLEPLADQCKSSTCERCRRGTGAQAFLCQAGRAKFNTKLEAAVYAKCVPAMRKYAAERRQALGIDAPAPSGPSFALWPEPMDVADPIGGVAVNDITPSTPLRRLCSSTASER